MESIAPANEEAVEAWSGVLFDRFPAVPPPDRVLDTADASTWIVSATAPS